MRTVRYVLLLVVALKMHVRLAAQEHYDAWFRTTLSVPVIDRFRTDIELQHRRQNGMGNNDPFHKKLTTSGRGWVHYRPNENVQLSFSPIGYFSNYRLIQTYADEKIDPSWEYRISGAAELSSRISKKVYLVARPAIEYRIFEHADALLRGRLKVQMRANLHSKISVAAYEEVLCNLAGENVGHFWGQNRLCAYVEYSVWKDLKVTIGYMRLQRQPMVSSLSVNENSLVLNVLFQMHAK